MNNSNNSADVFLALHQQPEPLILANAWDAASARIFEDLVRPLLQHSSFNNYYTCEFVNSNLHFT